MKILNKNQIVIYVIALMLVVAGYLNFTTNEKLDSVVTSSEELEKVSNIGDAQLVSSSAISEENNIEENKIKEDNIEESNIMQNNVDENIRETSNNIVQNNTNYFSISKLDRDTMYSQMLETYENILNSNNSSETQKQSAIEEIKKINTIKNSIMICENLIKNKGFTDVVIFVNGESINVIIDNEQLSTEEVAIIQNIISRELNSKVENIHISNKVLN